MGASMLKIAALIWIVLGTVLAGVALTVIVTVPALAQQATWLIPRMCAGAFVLAMPLSYIVARAIAGSARQR